MMTNFFSIYNSFFYKFKQWILSFTFLTLCFGLIFSPVKLFFVISMFMLLITLKLFYSYSANDLSFDNIDLTVYAEKPIIVNDYFYIDNTNIWFLLLTNFLLPFVILISSQSVKQSKWFYYVLLFSIFVILNFLFASANLLLFYILFEFLAIPMFLLIGLFGSSSTKIGAAYKFFMYSLFGAVTLLPALFWIFSTYGTLNLNNLMLLANFNEFQQIILFLLFFIPFAIKVPIIPVHLWLPEAHVEAPTPVSVLLAGLLLKTGGFAIYKFTIPLFPEGFDFWTPFVFMLALISIVYSSLYAVVQTDIKKMIAYASIGHMNFVTLGLFNSDQLGVQGAIYLMLTHGIISSGLFAGVGVLYDRYHTRVIRSYSGVSMVMPVFAVLFFILILGNIAFPFTGGFIAEFTVLLSTVKNNLIIALIAGISIFFCLAYSFWLFNRVFFGQIQGFYFYNDLKQVEVIYLSVLSYLTILSGFKSNLFYDQFGVYESYIFLFYGHSADLVFYSIFC